MTDKLRSCIVYLKTYENGEWAIGNAIPGFFHKFTQGNMANDHVIVEDAEGVIHILDMEKKVHKVRFLDRDKTKDESTSFRSFVTYLQPLEEKGEDACYKADDDEWSFSSHRTNRHLYSCGFESGVRWASKKIADKLNAENNAENKDTTEKRKGSGVIENEKNH